MVAYILSVLAGVATPTQASINGNLREKIRSPYFATLISFSTALLGLLVIVLCIEGNLTIPFDKAAGQPFWLWLGGSCGVIIVLSNVVCLPKLGSAVNIMLLSFGQIMAGLIIDNWGLFGSPQIPMTIFRAVGAVLVIVGVVLTVRMPKQPGETHTYPLGYMLFAMLGGVNCALQVAINGTLAVVIESSWKSTLVSMTVGSFTCLIVIIVLYMFKGRDCVFCDEDKGLKLRWYMLLGGMCAIIIVGSNAIAAPIIGAGMVTIFNLVGQMSTGLVIDAAGFLGIEVKPITKMKVLGIITMVVGTIIITLF